MRVVASWLVCLAVLAGGRASGSPAAPRDRQPCARSGCSSCPDTVALSSPDLELSSVVALDVDSRGNIYVADWRSKSISVLDPSGARIAVIGRKGAGPGEFAALADLQVISGDTLIAYDVELTRLTVFEPARRRVVRTISIAAAGGGRPMRVMAYPPAGYVALYQHDFVGGRPQESDSVRRVRIKLLDSAGVVQTDSFATMPGNDVLVARTNDFVAVRGNPFGRQAYVVLGGRQLLLATSDMPSIRVISLGDQAEQRVDVAFARRTLPRSVVEDTAKTLREEFRPPLRKGAPRYWPALRGLLAPGSDWIWVGLAQDPGRRVRWVAVDSKGSRRDSLDLPWATTPHQVRDSLWYTVSLDADDVPRVLVLRPKCWSR